MKDRQSFIFSAKSRREFLARTGSGLGGLALTYLLDRDGNFTPSLSAAGGSTNPLAPKPPHHQPKAKAVIWLFMEGGPSHIDLFDPKPALEKLAGQPMPASFGRPVTAMGTANNTLMPSKRVWKQYGESGIWVSDWYPRVAEFLTATQHSDGSWADGPGLPYATAMGVLALQVPANLLPIYQK